MKKITVLIAIVASLLLSGCMGSRDKVSEAALKEYNLKLNDFVAKYVKEENITPRHPMASKLPDTYNSGGEYKTYQSGSTIIVRLHFSDSTVAAKASSLDTFGVSEYTIKHVLKYDNEIKKSIKEALKTSL